MCAAAPAAHRAPERLAFAGRQASHRTRGVSRIENIALERLARRDQRPGGDDGARPDLGAVHRHRAVAKHGAIPDDTGVNQRVAPDGRAIADMRGQASVGNMHRGARHQSASGADFDTLPIAAQHDEIAERGIFADRGAPDRRRIFAEPGACGDPRAEAQIGHETRRGHGVPPLFRRCARPARAVRPRSRPPGACPPASRTIPSPFSRPGAGRCRTGRRR